jgi:YfiH family protein
MLIIKPFIFRQFPEITFGFSTKIGLDRKGPYFFNLSYSVGDDKILVEDNRKKFFVELGLNENHISYQKQIHSDGIMEVNTSGNCGENDALITSNKNLGLAISSADCPAIFIYDPLKKIIAAVHSGWRGTEKKILKKAVQKLKNDYQCKPDNLVCFIGPAISQRNYEVSDDVALKFDEEFIRRKNNKCYLDLVSANLKMLIEEGIKTYNMQISNLCTYEYNSLLHSYRRDGLKSGRALGVIAMKEII